MTQTRAPASAWSTAPRWMRVTLVASLALNLLVAGLVASAIVRFRHAPLPSLYGGPSVLGFTQTLPRERRQALWAGTSELRTTLRPMRSEIREARKAVTDAMAAEPFDVARFEKAQLGLFEADSRLRRRALDLYSAIAQKMTQEERAAFAKWRPDPHFRGRRWRKNHGERNPDGAPDGAPAEKRP
ncbi:MAG: periplasmic heavy metal sensor [Hyphomicrobiaceae bacterium]